MECLSCQKETGRSNKKYCNGSCYSQFRSRQNWGDWKPICEGCGCEFSPDRKKRFCSHKCRIGSYNQNVRPKKRHWEYDHCDCGSKKLNRAKTCWQCYVDKRGGEVGKVGYYKRASLKQLPHKSIHCPHCKVEMSYDPAEHTRPHYATIDHIIPKSFNGSNELINLQWLCRRCNTRKHDKAIAYTLDREVLICPIQGNH